MTFAASIKVGDVIVSREGTPDELLETVEAVRPAAQAGFTTIETRDQYHTGRVLTLRNTRSLTVRRPRNG